MINAFLLPAFALLDINGPDSKKFLQGQVTCDVLKVHSDKLSHSAHCTHKGRMVANFDLTAINDDHLRLRLPADNLNNLKASLSKYIVFSKAELSQPNGFIVAGLTGVSAYEKVSTLLGTDFTADSPVVQQGNNLLIPRDNERIECWLEVGSDVYNSLSPSADDALALAWQLQEIKSGQGWIFAETSEVFIPQNLNLGNTAINGISFTKGCYTGQEIVARIHYKGKAKRHMYLFKSSNTTVTLGSNVYSNGKSVGEIVNSCSDGMNTWLLACANSDATEAGKVSLDEGGSQVLTLQTLPYELSENS